MSETRHLAEIPFDFDDVLHALSHSETPLERSQMIVAIIRNNFSIRQVFAGPDAHNQASREVYMKYVNPKMKNWFVFACGGMLMHKKIHSDYR